MRDDDVVETAAIPAKSGMADLSGSVLADRYRLEGPLGQGSMANVYRAVDDRLGRKVAVKLFHSGQDGAGRARFAAEAQALARLSHPGLIGIYDAGVAAERPYLVMQLVDGESLRDRLLNGPLTSEEVVALGTRLALALAHVHNNGIVHRDIKPSNIVLDAVGSPHLADFGIALLLDAARMTSSNEIMGTAAYLSPEQITGADVTSAADIYSLGLVLLECLTGELEYPGGSKVESALARLHRAPRIPSGIAPVLAKLLSAMTSRDPADRPKAKDCAAWFVAVKEHRGMSGRGRNARLVAANWLARKSSQFGTSRTMAPLFSGWRRFAIAGSGLAMAIFASAWLFTSLLPRVMPMLPDVGGDAQPTVSTNDTAAGSGLLPRSRTAMHVAAALNGPTTRPKSGQSTTNATATPADAAGQLSITSTSDSGASTTTTSDSNSLQDTSVDMGSPSSVPTSSTPLFAPTASTVPSSPPMTTSDAPRTAMTSPSDTGSSPPSTSVVTQEKRTIQHKAHPSQAEDQQLGNANNQ